MDSNSNVPVECHYFIPVLAFWTFFISCVSCSFGVGALLIDMPYMISDKLYLASHRAGKLMSTGY